MATQRINQLLTSPRLTLRPLAESDFDEVHAYSSNLEVVKFMQWGPNTEEQTRNFMKLCMAHQNEEPRHTYDFAVLLKDSDDFLGSITLRVMKDNAKFGEIGYVYNPRAWGQGYASEAAEAIIRFGFDELDMQKVSATCDPLNFGSARVLQKCGMQLEGYLRKHLFIKGVWRDTLLFGCARGELEKNLQEVSLKPTHWTADNTQFQIAPGVGGEKAALSPLFATGELSKIRLKAGESLSSETNVLDEVLVVLSGALQAAGKHYPAGSIIFQPGATRKESYNAAENTELVAIKLGP
jgi:ribosomal-protein-alanine N-acetyltransferase